MEEGTAYCLSALVRMASALFSLLCEWGEPSSSGTSFPRPGSSLRPPSAPSPAPYRPSRHYGQRPRASFSAACCPLKLFICGTKWEQPGALGLTIRFGCGQGPEVSWLVFDQRIDQIRGTSLVAGCSNYTSYAAVPVPVGVASAPMRASGDANL